MTAQPSIPRFKKTRKALREPVWAVARSLARPTAPIRVLPDYLIIGAQRCGTTSLQDVLTTHPSIASARLMKGVHYFDTAYPKGLDWYRSHFPTRLWADFRRRSTGHPLHVGEASPYYIFHPAALDRIAEDLPDAKLILLLRDPVERTISHHKHETRRGNETLSLEDALDAEPERLAGEVDKVLSDASYNSFPLQTYSYAARSHYASQVARLLRLFPRDQVLIIPSERFFNQPAPTFARILDFIGAPPFAPPSFPQMNATKTDTMPDTVLMRLRAEFRESNETLFELVGERYPWQ